MADAIVRTSRTITTRRMRVAAVIVPADGAP
jgi:hypothetical protein